MNIETVRKGKAFNCSFCSVKVGQECLSVKGLPMARHIHSGRIPLPIPMDGRMARKLRVWLINNADIFQES